MAESNPTQVILTDDGIKIIKAQNTADNAASGVTNLNDPNLMSVTEKQNNVVQFAGLTSQYNVLVQNAKDDEIDTTAVTTAYNNLNKFMADVLADPDHASDVDRATYKKYQDAYNEELANLQSALQNNANNKFASAASAESQAASTANDARSAADSAFSQAQVIGSQVDSEMAVQSTATAKAQSTADSAFSQAKTAIDTGNVTSQAVTALKDGSTMTIAQLQNGLATKVSNSDYASYKDQTASQIGEMVTNGAFSAYKQTTAELISDKVSTSTFSAYQSTTASAIESKVESKDFNSYKKQTDSALEDTVSSSQYMTDKKQTDSAIESKVSTADFNNLKISNRNLALGTVTAFKVTGNNTENQSQNAYTLSKTIPQGTVVTVSFDVSSTTGAGTFTMQFNGNDNGGSWQAMANGNLTNGTKHVSATITTGANQSHAFFRLDNATGDITVSNFIISESSKEVSWTPAPEDQATESQFTQLSGEVDLRVKKGDLISDINAQAGNILISSSRKLTLSSKTIYFDTDNPVIIPSANISELLVKKQLKAADISANTFTTNNGTFTVEKSGLVTATSLIIRGSTNLVYNASLAGNNGSYIPGWNISNNGVCWSNVMHDGVPSIGWNNTTGAGVWANFAQTKLYPLNGATGQPYSASVWFKEDGSDTSLQYQFTLAFFDSNGNRINGWSVGNTWNGIGSGQDWRYVTINNAVAPSNAVYVGLQYFAYNGHGNACFSSPMLTQTAQATGYQPDTGNVVSAGEIDSSVINSTTFHGGNIISDSNNTSNFYPFTIEPTGKASTTLFNSMDAIRTEMSGGGIRTMYRAINSSGNQYEAYDGNFSGDIISLNSGFTNGQDMSFSQSVSGNQLTGQVVLSPLNGIHLWGSTQSIHFSGLQMNGTGITFNSYGNIIADPDSAWWRIVDFSGNQLANFGTDTAGSNAIQFNRELDVGNFHINTGHTFASADSGAIHFAMGKGGAADIYAGDVHYNSLVKSSLLSVKKDVKKADTAYWAQLVNSIDLATYQYKSDDNTSHIRLSSIVDDVNDTKQWRLPDVFISRDENGKLNGVDDSVLLNATLATVQEQQKEIDQLNGHNMKLEARLNKLEAKLNG
ncbi:phage tail protein [Lactiplantibacillus plantarum]